MERKNEILPVFLLDIIVEKRCRNKTRPARAGEGAKYPGPGVLRGDRKSR
jgi:hypothetical protein